MTKRYYVSKLVNGVEFVLCHFGGDAWEWVNATHDATVNGYIYTTTDHDEAQEIVDLHGEWDASVEHYEG